MSIATELTNLTTNITNAYNTISTKGGTLPANKNTDNLANAIDSIPSGGGSIVNGVVENFKANSATIDANTFVEFVNGITYGTDTQLSSTVGVYNATAAVAIDTNKVFVAYGGSSTPLCGAVCTINGTTITTGTETQLAASNAANISAAALDGNRIFVTYGSSTFYGVVCTVSGTTITTGTETQLATGTSSQTTTNLIGENKVFITHRSSSYPYGVVCTISNTTITVGTDTRLIATSNSYDARSVVTLADDKIFMLHKRSNYPYGIVCTINNTTITTGTDTQLHDVAFSTMYSAATLLNTNKVFMAWGSSSVEGYAGVCTIDGVSITIDVKKMDAISTLTSSICANTVSSNNVVIYGGYNKLYGQSLYISGTRIIAEAITEISSTTYAGTGVSAALLGGSAFVAHRLDNYLGGIVCSSFDFTVSSATVRIEGLTKTTCMTSTAGDVWVLNASQS